MGISQQIGASSLIKPGVIDSSASRPASPYEGQVIFQKDTDQLLVWNGTAWVIPNSPAQNPTGLELVSTTTVGTGVGSLIVSNCFTSTYTNYRIVMSGVGMNVNDNELRLVLNPGATGNYRTGGYYAHFATQAGLLGYNSTGAAHWVVAWTTASSAYNSSFAFEVFGPASGLTPRFSSQWATASYAGTFSGVNADTTVQTGFTLTHNNGTFTGGKVRVYGYRE